MRHAFLSGGLQPKVHQLVAGLVKAHGPAAAVQLHRAVGLYAHGGFPHPVLQGEDIHRDGHLFAHGQLAGQGSEHHERRLHGNGLFRLAVGALVGGHHHHAHTAHILGQPQFHHVRGAGSHRTGLQRQYHRIEAVVLAGAAHGILVTSDGRQRRQFSAVGANHLVVHVPGLNAQGLAAVHPAPGVRRLEGREVQQALIHQGQGISHGLAVFLGHLDGKGFLGMQFVRHGQHRLQAGGRVFHLHALHAVQADGKVVERVAIGLQQGNVHIDVGGHVGGDGKAPGRVLGR